MRGYQFPVIVAVVPNSLGERLGFKVGDRIMATVLAKEEDDTMPTYDPNSAYHHLCPV
jgi:hypothetical protein